MKKLFLTVAMFISCANADVNYNDVLTNMIHRLETKNGTIDNVFTNQLAGYSATLTNIAERANVELVRAIALADISEENLCGDEILPVAIDICSNLLNSCTMSERIWQRDCARIVLTGIYMFDGKYSQAQEISTNCVNETRCLEPNGNDARLWLALSRHFEINGLGVHDALRCYSALSIISMNSNADIYAYTNGLPESVCSKMRLICNGAGN